MIFVVATQPAVARKGTVVHFLQIVETRRAEAFKALSASERQAAGSHEERTPAEGGVGGEQMYTSSQILGKIQQVLEPELGQSIVDLGLVYAADQRNDGVVHLVMTLTAPESPHRSAIEKQVVEAFADDPKVPSVKIDWTFYPPWTIEMATMEARDRVWFGDGSEQPTED